MLAMTGSPFIIDVLPGDAFGPMCKAEGAGLRSAKEREQAYYL